MVHVVSFVTHITTTSIPVELSSAINDETDVNITLVSFYDSDIDDREGLKGLNEANIVTLGAKSRFDVHAFFRLWQFLRREDVDILHTHHNFIGSISRILGLLADVNIVNTEHRPHLSLSPLQNMVNFPTLPLADRVVSNSRATKQSLYWFEKLFLTEEQFEVVYNGVDLDWLDEIIQKNSCSVGAIQIVTVGRMIDVKNQETLLRAFKMVLSRVPDAELLLIGDGPRRNELEVLASKLGIADEVTFAGTIPREEVYQILSESDAFAITSRAEGFCVAAVEAMACGLPVVASDIPVFHEVVGESGRFNKPDDVDGFAEHLVRLCTDEKLRSNLGSAAERRAKSTFPIERAVEEYYKIYKDVAATNEQ